jgi:DNA-binding MarR family transcriptional regulator
MSRYYDSVLKPSHLRATQFTILAVVSKKAPVSINNLAKILVMDRSTLARDLQPLERQGFVSISSDQNDNRVRLVSITDNGNAVLQKAYPLWLNAQTKITEIFGEDRLLQLISELKEVSTVPSKA